MGLFSGILGGAQAELDVSTAVMVPTVAGMLADGEIDDDEVVQIRAICLASPIYARNSMDRDTEIILRAIKLVKDRGPQAMCEQARGVLSVALRETAFMFAVRLVFADGYVGQAEQAIIEKLTQWLEIPQDRAKLMIEAASIMQRTAAA